MRSAYTHTMWPRNTRQSNTLTRSHSDTQTMRHFDTHTTGHCNTPLCDLTHMPPQHVAQHHAAIGWSITWHLDTLRRTRDNWLAILPSEGSLPFCSFLCRFGFSTKFCSQFLVRFAIWVFVRVILTLCHILWVFVRVAQTDTDRLLEIFEHVQLDLCSRSHRYRSIFAVDHTGIARRLRLHAVAHDGEWPVRPSAHTASSMSKFRCDLTWMYRFWLRTVISQVSLGFITAASRPSFIKLRPSINSANGKRMYQDGDGLATPQVHFGPHSRLTQACIKAADCTGLGLFLAILTFSTTLSILNLSTSFHRFKRYQAMISSSLPSETCHEHVTSTRAAITMSRHQVFEDSSDNLHADSNAFQVRLKNPILARFGSRACRHGKRNWTHFHLFWKGSKTRLKKRRND